MYFFLFFLIRGFPILTEFTPKMLLVHCARVIVPLSVWYSDDIYTYSYYLQFTSHVVYTRYTYMCLCKGILLGYILYLHQKRCIVIKQQQRI